MLFNSICSAALLFAVFEVFEQPKFTNNGAIKVGSAAQQASFYVRHAFLFVDFLHDNKAVQESLTRVSVAGNEGMLAVVYVIGSGALLV